MKFTVIIAGKSFECEGNIKFGDSFKIGDELICSFTVREDTWILRGGKVTEITDEAIYLNGIKFPKSSCTFEYEQK